MRSVIKDILMNTVNDCFEHIHDLENQIIGYEEMVKEYDVRMAAHLRIISQKDEMIESLK